MTHRFLLGILLLLLVISAPAAQRATEGTGESWIFSSDEGGSGSSYLGVDIADVTGERLSELKLKEEHGAEITMVDSDAPAGKAGLKEHDVILNLNGTAVDSAAQLRRMIKETPSGRVVSLGISRDGQPMTIKVQLADRKKSVSWSPEAHEYKFEMPQMPAMPDIDIPISVVIAHSSLRSGLMVENITPQLGEFFGVKSGNGILVRSVEKGSRGEKAGFRAGDVIVKVSDQIVHDSSDFTHALHDAKGGSASVTVMRDKREQTLTITLPAKKDSGRLLENALDVADLTAQLHTAENAAHIAPKALEKTLEDAARAQEAAQDAAKEAQDACREQVEGAQKDMEKQLQDGQEQFRERQKMMQDRQQKIQHEMSGEWTEI
ncbi:MAG: PDZ domain-containing protein [Terriglobales bacterium]|jgi:membrane-associated protease RseP (regulator of RpoE activity)